MNCVSVSAHTTCQSRFLGDTHLDLTIGLPCMAYCAHNLLYVLQIRQRKRIGVGPAEDLIADQQRICSSLQTREASVPWLFVFVFLRCRASLSSCVAAPGVRSFCGPVVAEKKAQHRQPSSRDTLQRRGALHMSGEGEVHTAGRRRCGLQSLLCVLAFAGPGYSDQNNERLGVSAVCLRVA